MLREYSMEIDNNQKYTLRTRKKYEVAEDIMLTDPESIAEILTRFFHLDKKVEEYVYVAAFDSAMHPVGMFEISHGTVNSSLVSPREIMIRMLLCGAVNMVLCHNHPSGNPEPSKQDVEITGKLKNAGKLIDIKLIDHIIIGKGCLYSFMRNGLL